MDGQSVQPEDPVVIVRSPSNLLNRKIFIYVAILLLGVFLGFISWSILPFGKSSVIPSPQKTKVALPSLSPKPGIDESKLPVSLALLQNPMVYEWRGSVKGKIIKKDDHVFTLVDEQGNSITITDIPPYGGVFKTRFFKKINEDQKLISLKDIPLGSIMLGDFFIFKGGPNTPVGSVFVKE